MADTDQAIEDLAKGLRQLARAVQSLAERRGDDTSFSRLAKRAVRQTTRDHVSPEEGGATPRE